MEIKAWPRTRSEGCWLLRSVTVPLRPPCSHGSASLLWVLVPHASSLGSQFRHGVPVCRPPRRGEVAGSLGTLLVWRFHWRLAGISNFSACHWWWLARNLISPARSCVCSSWALDKEADN
ncbi:hypothetical protein V8C44DRAFT_90787 [Trichoderma aethiopicum]